jgi:hypothetical protein
MSRIFKDIVIAGYPSRVAPARLPERMPRTVSGALRVLESMRPTSGNLAPSESWRRMLGGRKRYNHQRQQIAEARREAILHWLMENRRSFHCELLGRFVPANRIIVRHGDCTMLASALGIGKATVCRDLSAVQATNPELFGKDIGSINYCEYMAFWRYAHRTGIGNEQPGHNLRFPANQKGPAARTAAQARRALGFDQSQSGTVESQSPAQEPMPDKHKHSEDSVPTADDFLLLLNKNCPQDGELAPSIRHPKQVPRKATV